MCNRILVADMIAVDRVARHRHGRGRPVTAPARSLYDEIQDVRAQYPPGAKSAVLPALRLAQERYGWLSPDAFREVADALEETPAYCESVASFYDMFHLAPVGEHLVEVCTNVSCALVGAQQVLEAFEAELGVRPGETTEDGKVTLRTVECAGGCGWGTVVAVDHRYREPVQAEDVPGDRGGADADDASRSSSRGAAPDRDLTKLAAYREVGGYDAARAGARDGAAGAPRRAARRERARTRRRRLPDGQEGELPREGHRQADLPRRQRGRVRAGHVQGPRDHVHRPAPPDRGLPDHRPRDRRGARLHLHPRRVPRGVRAPARRARAGRAGRSCSAASRSSSTAAPAPTSAARRRRCSSRSRASAASRGRSRRSRPSPACTRRRRSSTTSRRSRPCR